MRPFIGFIGRHNLRVDEKGRVTIPSRFKSALAEFYEDEQDSPEEATGEKNRSMKNQVFVRLSKDRNLLVQPLAEYAKELEEIKNLSDRKEKSRRQKDFVTALAEPEKIDTGGRIRLDPELRAMAGIDREVTLIGRSDSFEIWGRERWLKRLESTLDNLDNKTFEHADDDDDDE